MAIVSEYTVIAIGAIVGFSIPAIVLGILCMTSLFNSPIFGTIWFTFGCSSIGSFIMFILYKNAKLPNNYY